MRRKPVHFDSELCLYGDTYYYRATPDGLKKRVERSLGIKVGALQKDVLKAKKEFLASIERAGSAYGVTTFEYISGKYVRDRAKENEDPAHFSDRSFRETKTLIENHLSPFFGRTKIEDVDQAMFKEYCYLKRKKGLNLVNHRKVMNHFMKWCVQENYLRYRLELEIPKAARKERRKRVVLTDEEIKDLITACEGKVLLYVLMYLFMGMRNMEICQLRWDEVDFTKKTIFINPLSNRRRKARAIPINSSVFQLLVNEAAKPKHSDQRKHFVFPANVSGGRYPHLSPDGGIAKPWQKALVAANLDRHVTPHDCRATFEKFMHTNRNFTDTQREKMAGANIDVQKSIYVHMAADDLRGLEESVDLPEVNKVLSGKIGRISGGNAGGKPPKKKARKNASD